MTGVQTCALPILPLTHSYLGVPRQIPEPRAREILGPVLGDPSIHKVGQNVKYDMKVLARSGWALEGVRWDTMIASYLVNPSRRSHSLRSEEHTSELQSHSFSSYAVFCLKKTRFLTY